MLIDKKGFTLIEIMAVLAILGIITTIALPRYFDLIEDSRLKAVQSALAEGRARVTSWGSLQYLQYLHNGIWPTVDEYVAAADTIGRDGGDFHFSYTKIDENISRSRPRGEKERLSTTSMCPFTLPSPEAFKWEPPLRRNSRMRMKRRQVFTP